MRYLARYMTGGPISDKRLIKVEDDQVYFWARSKDKSGRQERVNLPGDEFVRAWSMHILPKGFTKVRSFGAWAYTKRDEYKKLCEQLCPQLVEPASSQGEGDDDEEPEVLCAQCAQRNIKSVMRLIEMQHRPSWLS